MSASYNTLSDHQYQISLEIETSKYRQDTEGKENEIPINGWIEIGVYAKDSNESLYLNKHQITTQKQRWKLV
ncbi:hypothetical protein [uncultured Dokdonia sp.]|uniref:hypothetical protein n=1 Tax=uncultured Dokdonia sp. TaxID=575653 RepID=UPI002612E6A4|nr:hypothetical protein [uncultured Dokdonia sp.]